MHSKKRAYVVFAIIKFLFSASLIVACFFIRRDPKALVVSILELIIIIIISNEKLKLSQRFLILHDLLMLLFNAQVAVNLLSGSRISMLLLSNLDMAFDLAGLSVFYIGSAIIVLAVSCLPIPVFNNPDTIPSYKGLSVFLAIELVFTLAVGNGYSPMYGYVKLIQESINYSEMRKSLNNNEESRALFYRKDIWDARTKDAALPDHPNVILVFAEGLSRHILTDPREIMPNLAAYEAKSIHFENYYNHTFATYRGLIGQLYSGYQMDNYDANDLISLQSIFADQGYHTCLINTEPYNRSFTQYLENMDFQELVSDVTKTYNGQVNTLSDTEAFELLFDTVSRLESEDASFFTVIYTMGTHMTFDGEEPYGDGGSSELNKFWNLDAQFSAFMDRFVNSTLYDDTIVIFTSDHATYTDEPYITTFSEYYTRKHTALDEIPLLIYFKGVSPETVNAHGKNSLDLAPTICDLLDLSVPNYFLGKTLFSGDTGEGGVFYDTIYYDTFDVSSSKNGNIDRLDSNDYDYFIETVKRYFSISRR